MANHGYKEVTLNLPFYLISPARFVHPVSARSPKPDLTVMKMNCVLLSFLVGGILSAQAQDWSKTRLEKSPRHQEWVTVSNGTHAVKCFVVYPEVKDKALSVLVIHENRGLTDWVRGVADQLAEQGYIAIAPDLLTGTGPTGGDTSSFASQDDATRAIGQLKADQVQADLGAVADYVIKDPAASGQLVVAGFCWGGGQSFAFATHRANLKASFVFYGTPPRDPAQIAKIPCPVYGFYGGNDARVDATIGPAQDLMKTAGKTYDPVTYEGAGHAFMRLGEDPAAEGPNKTAREDAWKRWKELLKKSAS